MGAMSVKPRSEKAEELGLGALLAFSYMDKFFVKLGFRPVERMSSRSMRGRVACVPEVPMLS